MKTVFQILLAAPLFANPPSHAQSLTERDTLLEDWGGLRSHLAEKGLSFELVYTAEYFENLNGGINEGGDYRGDISLFATLDTSTAGWWDNGEFFLHLQQQHGEGITERYTGDFQVLSNIDADDYLQISEIWYRHTFASDRAWLKIGKMESNADFAFVDYAAEFLNSSPGFSPTIPLTTYPDQDWGIVLGLQPNDRFSVNMGVYQGRPNGGHAIGTTIDNLYGPMVMIEPALHYDFNNKPGHLRFGAWWNGDHVEDVDGSGKIHDSSEGIYLTWDQELISENDEDEQGLGIFAQLGFSDEDTAEAKNYYGAGLQWTGPVDNRDEDILGFGIFHVELSDEAGFAEDNETTLELYYKAQLTPWSSIKPDIQYIANPGGTTNDDALAIGARLEILF
ncbi:MAG: carbohydrate porin [Candidatus Hydrogenedentota bacterium]